MKPRPIITQPDDPTIRLIALTGGQVAVVSTHCYDWLMQWNWRAWWNKSSHTYYAIRTNKNGRRPIIILMHREILKPREGFVTDHKDGDGLNNRDSNLREATPKQNAFNQRLRNSNASGVKGVCWSETAKLYIAFWQVNGKQKIAKRRSLSAAIRARAQGEIENYGEFRRDTTVTKVT